MADLEERVRTVENTCASCKTSQDEMRKSLDRVEKNMEKLWMRVIYGLLATIAALAIKEGVVTSIGHTSWLEQMRFGTTAFGYGLFSLYLMYLVVGKKVRLGNVIAAVTITASALIYMNLGFHHNGAYEPVSLAVSVPFLIGAYSYFMGGLTRWNRRSFSG